ncbi:MAG: hypothetical protein EOP83_21090 [Verrucomicrobiaceae bacterium]|nr:MAG: hypothetical protein EOP83_21090 [Verrucomicrobiaceae bacterium]
MKIVFDQEKRCYVYYARVRTIGRRRKYGRRSLLGILIRRPLGWQVEIEGVHNVNGELLFAGQTATEVYHFYDDLREAKRVARSTFARMEVNRSVKTWRMASAEMFRRRVNERSNEWKIRRAYQTAELRHTIRRKSYPMFVGDDFADTPEEMIEWLDERRCSHPTLEGFAYAIKRLRRAMTYRVHDVLIDFPDADTAFEFKMRWL